MDTQSFTRTDTLFSLCGLNCSLCPMFVRGDCIGCRAGSWCATYCRIAPCSVRHGGIDHCFECPEYPCRHYDGIDQCDSLISHRNQLKDMEKARIGGIDAYREEQKQKAKLLRHLLDSYHDGRLDVFFCLAANMLEIDDLKTAIEDADASTSGKDVNTRAEYVEAKLRQIAAERNIALELRQSDEPWVTTQDHKRVATNQRERP